MNNLTHSSKFFLQYRSCWKKYGWVSYQVNQLKNGIKNLNRCLCSVGLVKGIALNFLVDKTIF